MSRCTHPACDDGSVSPDRGQRARAARITAELSAVGLALPGTLIKRHVRCGKPRCACHADPPALHGPYWQWTRKVAGKTITRLVPDEQVAEYRQWIDNSLWQLNVPLPEYGAFQRTNWVLVYRRQRPPAPGAGRRAGSPHPRYRRRQPAPAPPQ